MVARQYYSAEAETEDSTTGSYVTSLTHTFTPDANRDYICFASSMMRRSTTSYGNRPSAFTDSSPRDADAGAYLSSEYFHTANRVNQSGFYIHEEGASPSSYTQANYFARYGSTGTCYIDQQSLVALRLEANDEFVTTISETSTTSSSYSTAQTLTFTPPSEGEYLILAQWNARGANTECKVVVDGVTKMTAFIGPYDFDRTSFLFSSKVNLTASSKTITIQLRRPSGSSTVYCSLPKIVALRLDDFPTGAEVAHDDSTSSTTATSSTWVDSDTSVTFTPTAGDHLIIGTCIYGHNTNAGGGGVRLEEDGSGAFKYSNAKHPGASNWRRSHGVVRVQTLAATSYERTFQVNRTVGSGTTTIDEKSITVLQLEEVASGLSVPIAHHHRQRNN